MENVKVYQLNEYDTVAAESLEQAKEMEQEYGLMVLLPEEVKQAYDEKFEGTKSRRRLSIPPVEEIEAYQKGYYDGNRVDYTKSTLDEGVFA